MALVKINNKMVAVNSAEQLLELSESLAIGLGDAIKEFFIEKSKIPELPEQLEDYEGPDEENIAGIDNEYFKDKSKII